jgi:hypothetical protein
MNYQTEARECARCHVESLDLDDFLWFDTDTQEWRTGPICIDRKACLDRRLEQKPVPA